MWNTGVYPTVMTDGWFKTTIKYFFLNTIFIIMASIAALIFLVGSALTY